MRLSTIQSSATRTHCSSRASSPSPRRLYPVLPPLRSWLLALKLAVPTPILSGATPPLGARPPVHSGAAPAAVWGHGPCAQSGARARGELHRNAADRGRRRLEEGWPCVPFRPIEMVAPNLSPSCGAVQRRRWLRPADRAEGSTPRRNARFRLRRCI
ncbi:hypothetical protein DFH09DRAFT_478650 [Mycena vulgaris]|nr:hypothetical protein DFH09DRAFT_478650 [Mycena vulgaris]